MDFELCKDWCVKAGKSIYKTHHTSDALVEPRLIQSLLHWYSGAEVIKAQDLAVKHDNYIVNYIQIASLMCGSMCCQYYKYTVNNNYASILSHPCNYNHKMEFF